MNLQKFFVGRAIGFVVVLAVVAVFLGLDSFFYGGVREADVPVYSLGTYGYHCTDGTEFTMQPAEGMLTLRITPASDIERFKQSVVHIVSSERGAKYVGDGITFAGIGETVTVSGSDFEMTCSPISIPDEAPFNFGD